MLLTVLNTLSTFEFGHMKGFMDLKMWTDGLKLFRKVKDKRAKRALAHGNEKAPPPYQQIKHDKKCVSPLQINIKVSVSKRSFSRGRAYYSRMDHNVYRMQDVAHHKGNAYYWAQPTLVNGYNSKAIPKLELLKDPA